MAGRIETVRLFTLIAIFILLIACINFMNLSTARSERRAREVGIRKVMGAYRQSLLLQFIGENLIKQELIGSGAAIGVTRSANPITRRWGSALGFRWQGSTETDTRTQFIQMGSDADFVKTTGVKLLQGRDIDIKEYPSDSTAMLLNESAVEEMRLKNPLGMIVTRDGGSKWTVVGVVKDFILESPFDSRITPTMITGPNYFFQVIHIKLNPAKTTAADLALAGNIFKKYNPLYPFEYYFTDDWYARKFELEQRTGTMAALFAGLTIFISCLGLFGLASYMAENRIKEIGIRKLLGASVAGIAALLSKDFAKLVLVSIVLASPIAWFAMDHWLQDYSYRVPVGPWIFILAGSAAMLIALLTICFQAIRAAMANPAKSLRAQ